MTNELLLMNFHCSHKINMGLSSKDTTSNAAVATDQARTEEDEFDLITDIVLQEMDMVLDDEKRHLVKTVPDSTAPAEQVRSWAAAVAQHRCWGKMHFDRDKITWRASDLHNCIVRTTRLIDGEVTCRPDGRTHTWCRLFAYQDWLPYEMKSELNDDAVLFVHIRKAVGRVGERRRWQRRLEAEQDQDESVEKWLEEWQVQDESVEQWVEEEQDQDKSIEQRPEKNWDNRVVEIPEDLVWLFFGIMAVMLFCLLWPYI